jgi:hypothetical protein
VLSRKNWKKIFYPYNPFSETAAIVLSQKNWKKFFHHSRPLLFFLDFL